MTAKPAVVSVVCAIIERSGRFLAAKRSAEQKNGLLWEFPGGKVDEGEQTTEALARELYEELGVVATIKTKLASSFHSYPWTTIELIPYICTLNKGEPHPIEHAEIRWVNKEEAIALEWAAADAPVLEEYIRLSIVEG